MAQGDRDGHSRLLELFHKERGQQSSLSGWDEILSLTSVIGVMILTSTAKVSTNRDASKGPNRGLA